MSEQWMDEPIFYSDELVKAVNPPFRDYMAVNEARRMGNLMKRALVVTLKVLADTGIEHPDAIITGTSIGSLDCTEKFLDAMVENEEETLSPTHFMQSTHNTVGSTLGIYTKTHGYNTTYSHGSVSFDQALLDAWMQMQLGTISTALVGGHDEMVAPYYEHLKKTGYVGREGMVPCGEVAVSMLLTTDGSRDHLCRLAGISISHQPTMEQLRQQLAGILREASMNMGDVSAVMTGVNGNPVNDKPYQEIIEGLFPATAVPCLHYKHLFGENYTVPALGVYAASHCLKKNTVPSFLYHASSPCQCDSLNSILMVNRAEGGELSLILLKNG